MATDGVVLIDKGVGEVNWDEEMVLPTNGYEAALRCLREVSSALAGLLMYLSPGLAERSDRESGNEERALLRTVTRFEGTCSHIQRTVESAIKALAHLIGRRQELHGHDVGKLCEKLVEPYRGDIKARLASAGADSPTRRHQDNRYTSQHVLDDPLTPERVTELAQVACNVARYLVEQLDESAPYISEVQDDVTLVEQHLEGYDLETGAPRS